MSGDRASRRVEDIARSLSPALSCTRRAARPLGARSHAAMQNGHAAAERGAATTVMTVNLCVLCAGVTNRRLPRLLKAGAPRALVAPELQEYARGGVGGVGPLFVLRLANIGPESAELGAMSAQDRRAGTVASSRIPRGVPRAVQHVLDVAESFGHAPRPTSSGPRPIGGGGAHFVPCLANFGPESAKG